MTDNSPRLRILIADYEQARDDERYYVTLQATLFSLALAALSIAAIILRNDCSILGRDDDCVSTPDAVLAAMPLIPLAIIIYLLLIGSAATIRSFYLRSLERELRSTLQGSDTLSSYPGLRATSLTEALVSHLTLARGGAGARPLMFMLLAAVLVVFGGITLYASTVVSMPWKLAMLFVYGGSAWLVLHETYQSQVQGRTLFSRVLRSLEARLKQPLTPLATIPWSPRSLMSYLIIPRPDDLVKAIFFPAVYLFALIFNSNVSALNVERATHLRALLLWLALELLIYAARYQWNDIRGLKEDQSHPESPSRRRLPERKGDAESLRIAVRTSIAGMAVRMYLVLILITVPGLNLHLALLVTSSAVFGLAAIYEVLRSVRPSKSASRAALSWSMYVIVGMGYVIRGAAAYWAASQAMAVQRPAAYDGLYLFARPEFVSMALFLAIFGSTFVILTWVLDASSYCLDKVVPYGSEGRSSEVRWTPGLKEKPHLEYLLERLRVPLAELPIDQESGKRTAGATSKPLISRDRWLTPHGLATILSGAAAGGVGAVWNGYSMITGGLSVAFFAALGVMLTFSTKEARWGALGVGVAFASAAGYALTSSIGGALAAVAPWLALSITVISFRYSSYADLKDGLPALVKRLRGVRRSMFEKFIGAGAAATLDLDPRKQNAAEQAVGGAVRSKGKMKQ